MKMLPRILGLSFLVLTVVSTAQSQGFLKVKGKAIVNEKNEEVILRGIGLGGWMLQEGYMLRVRNSGQQQHVIKSRIEELIGKEKTEQFYNAWLANHTRKIDIDSMAAWGFNSVRLPMHYNLYTLPVEQEPIVGENTWLEKGFQMTDSLLQWCKANKLYLILDLHAAPGGQGNDLNISDRDPAKPSLWDSQQNQKKMVAFWRKIAERYANEPWIGAYDIINEPNWGFENKDDKNGCAEQKNEPLRKLMVEITRAIREVDKNHIVIVEGNCWGNNYNGVFPLWDDNTVISFHKYWNYNDQNAIQKFIDIRNQNNAPVWLGESGENSNHWFREAIHLMETNQIGWAWWPLKKLGFNNPLEVKVPPGFQKILDHWNGDGPRPSADEAYASVMQLAEALKLENCVYHRDVIDAMFRQVRSNSTLPFNANNISAHTLIAAADYDLGRNGFAYFDKDTANYYISTGGPRTSGNNGHMYRNDGVDIGGGDPAGYYYVNNIEDGEWLQYTINVLQRGTYKIHLLSSSEKAGGKVSVQINDVKSTGVIIPETGKADQWLAVAVLEAQLEKGKNTVRVQAISGGFNLKSIEFVRTKTKTRKSAGVSH